MPRQILFVQGAGDGAHDQWDNKLVDSLTRELRDGYDIRYPRMPNEADPRYAPWKAALLKAFDTLEDGAILIGHSVGATVLLHTLADARPNFTPSALILLAPPFIGDDGWPADDLPARRHFDLPTDMPVRLYHGEADETVPVTHAHLYAKALPQAVIRILPDLDHQLNNDLSTVAADIRL